MKMFWRVFSVAIVAFGAGPAILRSQSPVGSEVAIARHLQDGEEFSLPLRDLLGHGKTLFEAVWTDGGGRRPAADQGHRQAAVGPRLAAGVPAQLQPHLRARRQFLRRLPRHPAGLAAAATSSPMSSCSASGSTATFDPADIRATRGGVDESGAVPLLAGRPTAARPSACSAPATSRCWRAR